MESIEGKKKEKTKQNKKRAKEIYAHIYKK
jgi:hypothetical protein